MMKTLNKLFVLALVLCCSFVIASCDKEENLSFDSEAMGLGGETIEANELDEWLYDNFVVPYNIAVKYRWDLFDNDYNAVLIPPDEENVFNLMSAFKKAWAEPLVAAGGETFFKKLSPKSISLIGSMRYVSAGAALLGTAEGGIKITLLGIEDFDPSSRSSLEYHLHTMFHEFGHIMHQTIMYPTEFMYITPGVYTANWSGVSVEQTKKDGCISQYAHNNSGDEFVEMLSYIIVYGKEWFDDYVAECSAIYANPAKNAGMTYDPGLKLREKEDILVTYLKDVWGVDLYDPAPNVKGLVTMVQEAIDEFVSNN